MSYPIFNFNDKLKSGGCFYIVSVSSGEFISGKTYDFKGIGEGGKELGTFKYKVVSGIVDRWENLSRRGWLLHADIGIDPPEAAREYYKKWTNYPPDTKMVALRLQKISAPPGFE